MRKILFFFFFFIYSVILTIILFFCSTFIKLFPIARTEIPTFKNIYLFYNSNKYKIIFLLQASSIIFIKRKKIGKITFKITNSSLWGKSKNWQSIDSRHNKLEVIPAIAFRFAWVTDRYFTGVSISFTSNYHRSVVFLNKEKKRKRKRK